MGTVVEVEEFGLGENPPDTTPPQGVVIVRRESDGWVRKYLYKAANDLSGQKHETKVLISEIPPNPTLGEVSPAPAPAAVAQAQDQPLRFSQPVRVNLAGLGSGQSPLGGQVPVTQPMMRHAALSPTQAPEMDSRLNLPGRSAVKISQRAPLGMGASPVIPTLGQIPSSAGPAPGPAPAPAPARSDVPLPLSKSPAPPASLPVACTIPMTMPDGTVLNPDDALLFKDFCALIPYLLDQVSKASPKGRPGTIPLSQGPVPGGLPSFGPAGGPFGGGGGGGFGGGGGNAQAGPGPVGVVTGPTPVGGPNQAGAPGPAGPAGPAGPGSVIDGVKKIDGNFLNVGAMIVVPGTTFQIVVGGDGKTNISFGFELTPFPFASVYDVFAGIEIDGVQYQLWRNAEVQGSGGDLVTAISASGEYYDVLSVGTHTVSLVYGQSPAGNPWALVASSTNPASIIAKHS